MVILQLKFMCVVWEREGIVLSFLHLGKGAADSDWSARERERERESF